ncbi:hypothetical protein VP01_3049g1 [Puccinia sorghi]|uniref:Uncharacterized protein n=1 Tax=Puccinia sorghi TaxID=27349 RepID=A0A0L6V1R2_9BASI|nr:hypothetical protein VP01_3049g1 [Puccinia sorghi]
MIFLHTFVHPPVSNLLSQSQQKARLDLIFFPRYHCQVDLENCKNLSKTILNSLLLYSKLGICNKVSCIVAGLCKRKLCEFMFCVDYSFFLDLLIKKGNIMKEKVSFSFTEIFFIYTENLCKLLSFTLIFVTDTIDTSILSICVVLSATLMAFLMKAKMKNQGNKASLNLQPNLHMASFSTHTHHQSQSILIHIIPPLFIFFLSIKFLMLFKFSIIKFLISLSFPLLYYNAQSICDLFINTFPPGGIFQHLMLSAIIQVSNRPFQEVIISLKLTPHEKMLIYLPENVEIMNKTTNHSTMNLDSHFYFKELNIVQTRKFSGGELLSNFKIITPKNHLYFKSTSVKLPPGEGVLLPKQLHRCGSGGLKGFEVKTSPSQKPFQLEANQKPGILLIADSQGTEIRVFEHFFLNDESNVIINRMTVSHPSCDSYLVENFEHIDVGEKKGSIYRMIDAEKISAADFSCWKITSISDLLQSSSDLQLLILLNTIHFPSSITLFTTKLKVVNNLNLLFTEFHMKFCVPSIFHLSSFPNNFCLSIFQKSLQVMPITSLSSKIIHVLKFSLSLALRNQFRPFKNNLLHAQDIHYNRRKVLPPQKSLVHLLASDIQELRPSLGPSSWKKNPVRSDCEQRSASRKGGASTRAASMSVASN